MMEGEREVPKTAARRRTKSAAPAAGLRPVYIVDGARTPFLRARGKPGPFTPVDLAVQCARRVARAARSTVAAGIARLSELPGLALYSPLRHGPSRRPRPATGPE
jgi:hypothetical protein